jgi:restriction system protein
MEGPRFVRYVGSVLRALDELGGSGRPEEVRDRVAQMMTISEQEQSETLPSGTQTRFGNQVAWAKFYLSKSGYIESSRRGVWTLTEKGKLGVSMTHADALRLTRGLHAKFAKDRAEQGAEEPDTPEQLAPPSESGSVMSYRERLSEKLQGLPPPGFERFCQRLLRESGFEQVAITGRSGDGGIDGIGILQVNPLVSFKVLFQCKRYSGSVNPSQVRDFRGAMMGRADKGIILTTGTFTVDARKEAVRDGVPPIELVDGEKLLEMCENLELGLKPKQTYEIDDQFFEEFIK